MSDISQASKARNVAQKQTCKKQMHGHLMEASIMGLPQIIQRDLRPRVTATAPLLSVPWPIMATKAQVAEKRRPRDGVAAGLLVPQTWSGRMDQCGRYAVETTHVLSTWAGFSTQGFSLGPCLGASSMEHAE